MALPHQDPSGDRDAAIVDMLKRKDPDGLRFLMHGHGGRVKSLLHREFPMLRDPDLDDALSLAAHRAWQSAQRFDTARGTLRAWFYVITRNCAIGILREHARENTHVQRIDPERIDWDLTAVGNQVLHNDVSVEETERQQAFLDDLRSCISKLTPLQRKVIEADLRTGDAAAADELADENGTSVNTIYSSRSQARKSLKHCLSGRGHDFAAMSGAAE